MANQHNTSGVAIEHPNNDDVVKIRIAINACNTERHHDFR